MKKCLYHTVITMNNNGRTMLVLGTMLTLAVGVILSTTILQQQVSAQNMTAPTPRAAEVPGAETPCPEGQERDEVGNCVPVGGCPPGSVWQAEPPPGACVAERKPCPPGQIWTGPPQMKCIFPLPPSGAVESVEPAANATEPAEIPGCPTGQKWDTTVGACVPINPAATERELPPADEPPTDEQPTGEEPTGEEPAGEGEGSESNNS